MLASFIGSWKNAYTGAHHFFRSAEEEMSRWIGDFIEGYENTARRVGYSSAVQQYLLSDNPGTVIFSYNTAYGFLADAFLTSKGCKNIFLYADTGRYLCANRGYIAEIRKVMDIYGLNSNTAIKRAFFVPYSREGEEPLLLYFFPVYGILSITRTNRAFCVLICDMTDITASIAREDVQGDHAALPNPLEGAAILLFDQIVISSNRPLEERERLALEGIASGRGRTRIGRAWYLTAKVSFPEEPWDFIYMISERAVINRVFALLDMGLLALCAVIIVIMVILRFILRSVNAGISRMVEDLSALEYGTEIQFRAGGPHLLELEKISHSVSLMLERLDCFFGGNSNQNKSCWMP